MQYSTSELGQALLALSEVEIIEVFEVVQSEWWNRGYDTRLVKLIQDIQSELEGGYESGV